MSEYTAVSRSALDTGALVAALNEHALAGWEVVSVVSTGSELTAVLRRDGIPGQAVASAPVAAVAAPAAVSEPAGWGAQAAQPAMAPVEQPAPATPVVTPQQPAPSNATVAITHTPAGWYPDPSGRFEMRYWDGLAWTEHVSRQGQQYTDPPTA